MSATTLETAKRIRIGRTEKGWTQKQLAEAAGCDQAEISRYENGRQSPTGTVLDRIMAALGQSVALDAMDGVLRIHGREAGKFRRVSVLTEAPPIVWVVEGFAARGS